MSNKIKSILFISAFGKVTEEFSNDRVCTLYDNFEAENKSIVITDFDHLKKSKRSGNFQLRNAIYLPVSEYKSNLSLARIFSHWVFAFRLRQYLNSLEDLPEVIYCLVPTPSSCYIAGKFAKKHGIFFVSDIIDVWPDGLFPLKPIYKNLKYFFFPWRIFFNHSLRFSDLIFAANSSYAKIAREAVKNKIVVHRAFLGSSSNVVNFETSEKLESKVIKICYGGSLGNIYDFDLMFEGIDHAASKGHNIEFWIIGGGDLEEELMHKSRSYSNFQTIITGKISYDQYLLKMRDCQIGLNLFKPNELVSMSYKLHDYLSCNLYVFNSLHGDAEEILQEFGVGSQVNSSNFATSLIEYLEIGDFPDVEKFRKVNEQLNTVSISKNIENLISYEKNNLQPC